MRGLPMGVNLTQQGEIAEAVQDEVNTIYRKHGWSGPPKVTHGLVSLVLKHTDRIAKVTTPDSEEDREGGEDGSD